MEHICTLSPPTVFSHSSFLRDNPDSLSHFSLASIPSIDKYFYKYK